MNPSANEVRPKMEVVKPKIRGSEVGNAGVDEDQNNRSAVGQDISREMDDQGQAHTHREKHKEVLQKRRFDQVSTGACISNGDEASKLGNDTGCTDENNSTLVAAPTSTSMPASMGFPKPAANYEVDYWNVGQDASRPHTLPGTYVHTTGGMSFHGPSSGGSTDYWVQDEKELKRQRRKEANRESARRSRMRKQTECDELAEKVQALTAENDSLRTEVERLSELCQKLSSENLSLQEQLNK